ncbi:MAG TPA: HEAT repeat domain-containing protein, partial [Gaiellales bacterium]
MPVEKLAAVPLDELVERALAIADREADERYAALVGELQRRADRTTFARAVELCERGSEWQQRLGVDILGQLGGGTFAQQSLPVVLARCAPGSSGDLLRDALLALGQLGDPRALDVVLEHLRHPDADVRFGVIHALGGLAGEPPGDAIVAAAIELTRDPDDDVRNWATSVLGLQLAADGDAIRDALAARLDDPSLATRAEAAAGLAARGDPRAADVVLAWLESP